MFVRTQAPGIVAVTVYTTDRLARCALYSLSAIAEPSAYYEPQSKSVDVCWDSVVFREEVYYLAEKCFVF